MVDAGLLASCEDPDSVIPYRRVLPLSQVLGVASLGSLEQSDAGWEDAFRMLTTPNITRLALGDPDDA